MREGAGRRLVKSLLALVLIGSALLLALAGLRQTVYPASGDSPGLLAQRFANPLWQGQPSPPQVETRTHLSDAQHQDMRGENFSLRLAGFITIYLPGPYILAVESDDDSRLFLDGRLLVDNLGQHGMLRRQARLWLGPGRHLLEVEYAQRGGGAGLRLWWGPPWRELGEMPLSRLAPLAQPLERQSAQALGGRTQAASIPLQALALWGLVTALFCIWFSEAPRLPLALAGLILLAGMWANSGNLAPLAATQNKPLTWNLPGCPYLVSIDHHQFTATYHMLDGQPAEQWSYSLVLRRVLYPLIAFPFMKAYGFHEGGFLASLLLHLLALLSWGMFLLKRVGRRGALWGALALALSPGAYYWSSLPYSYVFIVPGSLWCFMALLRIDEAKSAAAALGWCLALGALFLGYDLWPFFLPAAALLILWRRRSFLLAGAAIVPLALPTALMILLLSALGAYSAPLEQGHEPLQVLRSFLGNIDTASWGKLVLQAPWVAWLTWFYSNYVFLPALFLMLLALWRRRWPARLQAPEACLLLATALVFLFNNLAPPYQGWQFRGEDYLRFYQPLLAALLYFTARKLEMAGARSWVGGLCALALAAQAYVVFAPLMELPGAGYLHWRFGRDGAIIRYEQNLAAHGRRPLGCCPPLPANPPR